MREAWPVATREKPVHRMNGQGVAVEAADRRRRVTGIDPDQNLPIGQE
jgi:hypothetical protein